jgi:uncharacterized protein (TIGR02300 family)
VVTLATISRIDYGTKCQCVQCEARFYDLHRVPAVCPKCAASQPPKVARPVRRMRAVAPVFREVRPVVEEEVVEPVGDVAEEDDEEILTEPDYAEIGIDGDHGTKPE